MQVNEDGVIELDVTIATSCNSLMRARNFLDVAMTEIMDARNALVDSKPDESNGALSDITDAIAASSDALRDSIVRIMGIGQ